MKNRRFTIFAFVAGAVLVGLLTAGPPAAMATTIPDFNLFVCQTCSTPPSAPTLITSTTAFNVGDGGKHATVGPLLIIVGTYDGAPAPTVTMGTNTYTPGGAAIYGWNGSPTGVTFDSSSTGSAYATLGFSPEDGGSSEQFSNWNSSPEGLTGHGILAATSFTLYAYELTGVTLPAMGTITLDLEGATNGSFVIGYACEETGSPCADGKEGTTPFTTSGIVDSTAPEASAVTLTSLVLLAFGGMVFRARRNELA